MDVDEYAEENEVDFDFTLQFTQWLPNGAILATSPQFPHKHFLVIPDMKDA